jgi:hypothetical protein
MSQSYLKLYHRAVVTEQQGTGTQPDIKTNGTG